ncbi:MAG: hypothetical protein JWN37_519 [Candidatus Nomurabacteria bacterium]|nr:hypothetical protein [Candidatus Nomurabacteria bacterium]
MDQNREIWLARHFPAENTGEVGWQQNAKLRPEAENMAERVKVAYLQSVSFAAFGCSMMDRAHASLGLLFLEIGNGNKVPVTCQSLGPLNPDEWGFFGQLKTGTIEEIHEHAPEGLLDREGVRVLERGVIMFADAWLQPGEKAFLVSHTPFIEGALAALKGYWDLEFTMGKGDILVFTIGERGVESTRHLIVPK